LIPYVTGESKNLTELTRPYRNVQIYEGNPAVKAFEREVKEIIVYSSTQLDALLALKARYEGDPSYSGEGAVLTEEERSLVSEEVVVLLEQKIKEAQGMEDQPSSIVWKDQSGSKLDVSMSADSKYTLGYDEAENVSYMRGYLDLDSEKAKQVFDQQFKGSQPFTVEAYLNMNNSYDEMNMIFGKGDQSMGFRGTASSLYFFIHNGTDWKTCEATGLYLDGWHHVAAMYSPDEDGTLMIALDGSVVQKTIGVGTVSGSSYPLGIGHDAQTDRCGDNSYAAVRVYDRVLTEKELRGQREYDLGACAEPAVLPSDESAKLWYEFASKPALVHFSKQRITLQKDGPTKTVTVSVAPRNYHGASLSVASQDESIVSIASVRENGSEYELRPGALGETALKAETDGGLYSLCRVTVREKPEEEPGNTDPGTAPNDPNQPAAPGPSGSPGATSAPKASEVTGLRAVKNGTKSITLAWDGISGAVYEVRRFDPAKKKWITQKTNIQTPGFTDNKCKPGKHYKYIVACTNQAAVSKQLDTATKPKKPVIRSVKRKGKALLIKWKKCSADSIEIYVKSGKGKFKKLAVKKGSAVSYKAAGLAKKKNCSFKIRAFMKGSGKKIYSAYSKVKSGSSAKKK